MLIRPFEASDADALAPLFHASVHEGGIRDYSPKQVAAWSPSKPDPERYWQQAHGRTLLVAIDEDSQAIGYGDLEPDGHIDHLYCRPDRVGTGVGSAIYAAIEDAAIHMGITLLFVEASEAARRLLERRGFRVDARNDFTINGVAIHNYRMSKRIGWYRPAASPPSTIELSVRIRPHPPYALKLCGTDGRTNRSVAYDPHNGRYRPASLP